MLVVVIRVENSGDVLGRLRGFHRLLIVTGVEGLKIETGDRLRAPEADIGGIPRRGSRTRPVVCDSEDFLPSLPDRLSLEPIDSLAIAVEADVNGDIESGNFPRLETQDCYFKFNGR